MKYSDWQLKQSLEATYIRNMDIIFEQYFENTRVSKNPDDIINYLHKIANSPVFQDYCENIAYKMVTMVEQQNMKSWREAASKGSRGHEIYNILMQQLSPNNPNGIYRAVAEQIMKNASIIKTLPYDITADFTGYIQKETFKGRRASDISKDLQERFKSYSKSRINLIARTEVSKTQCTLTQARAQNLGLDWYIWHTSKDSRVRHAHDKMDGVLVKWSEPPNPDAMFGGYNSGKHYHAGMIYNCRCYSEPVIDIKYVDFPRKVYRNGSIKSMTKSEFEKNM